MGKLIIAVAVLVGCSSSNPPTAQDATVGDDAVVDPCNPNPCANAGTCTATGSTFACSCAAGFVGATCETDVDECATDHGGCDPLASCTNIAGGRTCSACPTGYTGDGEVGCTDVDECMLDHGGCDPLTTCTNIGGGRACGPCPTGYEGDGTSGCTNIDECLTNHGGCDPLTTCDDTDGGRTCGACPADYAGSGDTGCIEPLACASDALDAMILLVPNVVAMHADCAAAQPVCCPGGVPGTACGEVAFDYTLFPGDYPRLVKTPASGPPARIDIELRARLKTLSPIPITIPVVGECEVVIDTHPGPIQDVRFDVALARLTDSVGPYLAPSNPTLSLLTSDDYRLEGNLGCQIVNFGLFGLSSIVLRAFTDELQAGTCTTCPCRP